MRLVSQFLFSSPTALSSGFRAMHFGSWENLKKTAKGCEAQK